LTCSTAFVLSLKRHPHHRTVMMDSWSDPPPEQVHGKSIVVGGMLQMLDGNMIPQIDSLMELCKLFDDGKCHVRISVSTDEHLGLHAQLEQKHPGLNIHKDLPAENATNLSAFRTFKMAVLRNALLQECLSLGTDFLMFADLEGTVWWNERTLGVITNVLKAEHEDKWDAVSFLGTDYYDWWAVRCNATSTNCWADQPTTCIDQPTAVPSNFECIDQAKAAQNASGFLQVDSAFNGLAIYKRAAIGNCKYDGRNVDGRNGGPMGPQDCEHVAFNRCLKQEGKRFMLNTGRAEIHHLLAEVFTHLRPMLSVA